MFLSSLFSWRRLFLVLPVFPSFFFFFQSQTIYRIPSLFIAHMQVWGGYLAKVVRWLLLGILIFSLGFGIIAILVVIVFVSPQVAHCPWWIFLSFFSPYCHQLQGYIYMSYVFETAECERFPFVLGCGFWGFHMWDLGVVKFLSFFMCFFYVGSSICERVAAVAVTSGLVEQ